MSTYALSSTFLCQHFCVQFEVLTKSFVPRCKMHFRTFDANQILSTISQAVPQSLSHSVSESVKKAAANVATFIKVIELSWWAWHLPDSFEFIFLFSHATFALFVLGNLQGVQKYSRASTCFVVGLV